MCSRAVVPSTEGRATLHFCWNQRQSPTVDSCTFSTHSPPGCRVSFLLPTPLCMFLLVQCTCSACMSVPALMAVGAAWHTPCCEQPLFRGMYWHSPPASSKTSTQVRDPAPSTQVANPDFFSKTLPLFDAGDDVGMVLSPQAFHNLNPSADIFNHGNIQFWEYAQHGYDALGFISCTGALSHVFWRFMYETCLTRPAPGPLAYGCTFYRASCSASADVQPFFSGFAGGHWSSRLQLLMANLLGGSSSAM